MHCLNKSQPWLTWGWQCNPFYIVDPALHCLTRTELGLSNVCRPEGRIALRLSINRCPRTSVEGIYLAIFYLRCRFYSP